VTVIIVLSILTIPPVIGFMPPIGLSVSPVGLEDSVMTGTPQHYYFTESELKTLRAKYKSLRALLSAERLVEASRPRADLAQSPQHGYFHDGYPIVGVTKRGKRYWARIRVAVAQNGTDRTVSLGYYDSPLSAGWAYRIAHYALWGECSYCSGEADNAIRQVYRQVVGE